MTATRVVSVIGLAFGDCGKGACTDALVRRLAAHTVVRFNGGGQAGHNVVLADGRHHTYSQFGAGTFVPGVRTVLAHPVVVHPSALLAEAEALARLGVGDALARLAVDPRCLVTTPFHQAAGRLRELHRGMAAHGSCGAGFGETVGTALADPQMALRWRDLRQPAAVLARRLDVIRHAVRAALARDGVMGDDAAASRREWRVLDDDTIGGRWLDAARAAANRVAPADVDDILARLATPGTLVYEGAQGALLDEHHGFHPHTTWSSVGTECVEQVANEAGRPSDFMHLGVLRTYLTRHGAGPFPTEDRALDAFLPESHNTSTGWQGRVRRGHADAILLRYAIDAVGPLHGLAVTHLDAIARGVPIRWCNAYRSSPRGDDGALCVRDAANADRIVALRAARPARNVTHGCRLGELLSGVAPIYAERAPSTARAWIKRIEAETALPVVLAADGPTHAHAKLRRVLAQRVDDDVFA